MSRSNNKKRGRTYKKRAPKLTRRDVKNIKKLKKQRGVKLENSNRCKLENEKKEDRQK